MVIDNEGYLNRLLFVNRSKSLDTELGVRGSGRNHRPLRDPDGGARARPHLLQVLQTARRHPRQGRGDTQRRQGEEPQQNTLHHLSGEELSRPLPALLPPQLSVQTRVRLRHARRLQVPAAHV